MSMLEQAPNLTAGDAAAVAADLYAIQGEATPLPAERDQNFLLTDVSGERRILKIANGAESRTMLETQNAVMAHLAGRVSFCPRVIPTRRGAEIADLPGQGGRTHMVRLVTFLPGTPMGEIARHTPALLTDLGRRVGQLAGALADFDHPGAHRTFHWDLAEGPEVVAAHRSRVRDGDLGRIIDDCMAFFTTDVAPLLPALRQSVIHNDANDHNVIVGGGTDLYTRHQAVTGIIDFGDMVYSHTVNDLAIAAAYAILEKTDPLAAAAAVVAGCHGVHPLEEVEIAALFGLIRLRLCVSVCMAAFQTAHSPENEYLSISQRPIRETLPRLAAIHPRFAEATLRRACGLPAVARGGSVEGWLRRHQADFGSVMEIDPRSEPVTVFDLSIASPLMSGDPEQNAEPELTPRLFGLMAAAGAKAGIGRYDEVRMIYTSPLFAGEGGTGGESRCVHLGMDLFAEAGSPVFGPLEGIVHLMSHNTAHLDYGPVVILAHRTGDGERFYTLYGHLATDCLNTLKKGQRVRKGEQIARLGTSAVNGGWTPHLHFQIILDLLDQGTDFPGVVRAGERAVWKALSPDPNLILGIPAACFPAPEPDRESTLRTRRQRIGRNLSIGYRDPVKVVRGWKQYLFDETGRRYLDAYNNVPHVGHCHPKVVAAAAEQMGVLCTNTRYLHDAINRYAEGLCATLPDPLSVCFIVNSASEGNELALRLARSATGRRETIVLEAAYHGHTTSLIDISPYKHAGPGGGGPPAWVHVAPIADTYRGTHKADDPQAGIKYADAVRRIIHRLSAEGRGLAGFIAESCPSVGGQIFFPEGYLTTVYAHVRAAGGICIADEVQTGYGRIGTHFYAFEAQGVVPDIVVLGKPIGNGHPISAVITTPAIAEAFDNGMEFFSTFGGNTVSCTVGRAVLETVAAERLQQNALRSGDRLLAGLRPFASRYPLVGDVRGSGLFLGIELVRDRETLEPAAEEASFVVDRMREAGILMGTDGPFHNVLKIRPPMPFNTDDADRLVETLDRICRESFSA